MIYESIQTLAPCNIPDHGCKYREQKKIQADHKTPSEKRPGKKDGRI